jgi:hypothetical protein
VPNSLKFVIFILVFPLISGCAALWVTDKAVDTVWFATKTTAKAGAATAELTWDAGSAAVNAAAGDDEEEKGGSGEHDD